MRHTNPKIEKDFLSVLKDKAEIAALADNLCRSLQLLARIPVGMVERVLEALKNDHMDTPEDENVAKVVGEDFARNAKASKHLLEAWLGRVIEVKNQYLDAAEKDWPTKDEDVQALSAPNA